MIMKEPLIRFQYFNEPWVDSICGDLFIERVEKNILAEMLSVTMNKGVIKASENGRCDTSSTDKSHYKLVKIGDIAYNTMRMWQGASGVSIYEGIVSPAYTVIEPTKSIDANFFACLFKTPKALQNFRINSQGLTSDTWNLKYPLFSKIKLSHPSDIKEQQTISAWFKSLEDKINTTSDKLSSLRQVKIASLQAMFPQKGKSVPKIRFKGFDQEWKKSKLNDFLIVSKLKNKEGSFTKDDVLSVSREYGIVNQIAFQGRSFAGASVLNYGVVEHKNIVYTKSPLKNNPYGIIKANLGEAGIVSTLYAVYKCCQNIDALFVQYYFESDDRLNAYLRPLVRKGAKNDMKVSAEGALLGNVIFPSYEEQKQIALFFSTIDKQISLEEQKLESLKRIKSACLDKMFC